MSKTEVSLQAAQNWELRPSRTDTGPRTAEFSPESCLHWALDIRCPPESGLQVVSEFDAPPASGSQVSQEHRDEIQAMKQAFDTPMFPVAVWGPAAIDLGQPAPKHELGAACLKAQCGSDGGREDSNT